jgi:hypothetical protein
MPVRPWCYAAHRTRRPIADTGTAKSGVALQLGALKWLFLALGHSLLPLVCRFQHHNVRPKSVLGKQDIEEASFCISKAKARLHP